MIEPRIIYENQDFIAVDKPSGMVVHPFRVGVEKREDRNETYLTDWLLSRYPEIREVGDDPVYRPGIVHRLDKETSGILLVPKTNIYFQYLKNLFQSHLIQKTYITLVYGEVADSSGVINRPIGIKNGTLKRSVRSTKMQKEAITHYVRLGFFSIRDDVFTLLKVLPKTGRTHQIRVHLSSISHPIAGDVLYGRRKKTSWSGRLMLHAFSLEFDSGREGRLSLVTEIPPEFRDFTEGIVI